LRFVAAFIDSQPTRVKPASMDLDDILPRKQSEPLAALGREDLDPLSVDELHARIAALEAEIARASARIDRATSHRASADAIFKR
jgi:uncharacterized small protein (DUF1192 family)